jgi:uncharacterized membrane protein
MLVIATFAVASMVSAYASASSSATPRSFALVLADDVSQFALSTFIGAFIYSIVALMAVKNEYYASAGIFTLFVLTVAVFGIVVITFVRWVDRVARLGRLGATVDKVEQATAGALRRRHDAPTLGAVPAGTQAPVGQVAFAKTVGYVQHIDVAALQAWVERADGWVEVAALPGTFAAPGQALAYVRARPAAQRGGDEGADRNERAEGHDGEPVIDLEPVLEAFLIGENRLFDDDPRFGLVVLSEIAGRALSPAVNDPGTAIDIIGTLVRLFASWTAPTAAEDIKAPKHDRVAVPPLSVQDMFDDAFTAIARDGAGSVEVSVRLQKALRSLVLAGDAAMRDAALYHARLALSRAEKAMPQAEDLTAVRGAARSVEEAARQATA